MSTPLKQQRLEEQERRHREEKERRMRQQREIAKKEKETADKIAARAFAQSYLADLVPTVFGTLSDNGYFYDPVERDLEQGFMPWLMEQVTEHLKKSELGRMVLDGILREVVSKRMDLYAKIGQKPATPENQSEQKDQQKDEPVQDTPSNVMPPSASATSEGEKPVEQADTEQKADEGGEPEQEQQGDDDAGGED